MDKSKNALMILSKVFMGLAVVSAISPFFDICAEFQRMGFDLFNSAGGIALLIMDIYFKILLSAFMLLLSLGIRKFLELADDIAVIKGKIIE